MNQSRVERKNGRYLIPFIFTITTILLFISLTFMQNGTAEAASLPESAAHSPTAPSPIQPHPLLTYILALVPMVR